MYDARVYTYDANSRLRSANYPGVGKYNYVYDWVGNRTSPGGMEYNAADQLVTRFVHTYSYDGAGNLTQDNNIVYAYTPANLLQSVTNGSAVSSMTWDASGNRVSFTSSADTQNPYYFVYDVTAGIPAVVEEQHNGSSAFYIREPGGALIARVIGSAIRYYHFDDLGSTLFLTDSTGTLTDKYAYDAWGNVTHSGNTSQPYQYVGQLGYYTHTQDSNMDGLLQLGVRFYDPEVGRFTQVDPAEDDLNWYVYVRNNPVKFVDPSGLFCTKDFVYHYYHGGKKPINLKDVGLLDDFINSKSVQTKMREFRALAFTRASKEARSLCRAGCFSKKRKAFLINSNTLTNVTRESCLFAVGNSIFFRKAKCSLTVDCWTRHFSYRCTANYSIRDIFEDPLDIGIETGGTPYQINASWDDTINGEGYIY